MREAYVSGRFYPSDKKQLLSFLDSNFKQKEKKIVKGVISPHAGYVYSGEVASDVFSSIKPSKRYIILGPNHAGYGEGVSISDEDSWMTPLGCVNIDCDIRQKLLESGFFRQDALAHKLEHSIEVQLPFLQYLNSNFSFVPISLKSIDKNLCFKLAEVIANTIKETDDRIVIIASSDMTHYESHDRAYLKDQEIIKKIIKMDSDAIYDNVIKQNLSICGFVPIVIMIKACEIMGSKNAELVKYQTSGDVTGDRSSVVGYAGIIVY